MNRLKLCLDVESINKENEFHLNNFDLKIKNLAEHCINYINGHHSKRECQSLKYNKEFHISETNIAKNIIFNNNDFEEPDTNFLIVT